MAKVFSAERLVPAWLDAARSLNAAPDRTDRNFVLEISSPARVEDDDLQVINAVDETLRAGKSGFGVFTVAGTIFPQGLYLRSGRPDFYKRYLDSMKAGKKEGTWGTYAMRMMERTHPKSRKVINPLDTIVTKLQETKTGRKIKSAYELGVHDVTDLLHGEIGCELPIHEPATDGGRATNIPCLSHLSFKLDPGKGAVDLTAVYRSHYYAQRALGNLVGLSQLLNFVTKESGYAPGVLTCVSTLAHLDAESFGGTGAATALLKRLRAP
ncbi:hypothetical protein DX912_11345 [Lysobacter soli]|uniref:Thymidylate synthase n=1 Tax=Lysobacter soli TaxID=453783 RepID=A0A3D8VBV1_9GAMM|nr:hypothetical protein [Lysobacter soli]RDY66902.1 hypothetical protein DX912_11345 [Lysobacter soli]